MIRVVVVDDHAIVRRGLRQILSETQDILVGGEASSGNEVLELLERERFDVALLDIGLPGGSGLALLPTLRRRFPRTAVIVLTMYSDPQFAVRAIRSGAAGFLTKESAPEQLVEAVRCVASGRRYVSAELAETLASIVAGDAGEGAPHERLTDRELEVLRLLANGKTVTEIARELSLSVKTISTHRTRTLKKLHLRTTAELLRYAIDHRLVE